MEVLRQLLKNDFLSLILEVKGGGKVGEPTVSVILPVYNNQRYLKESISSILEQTYEDFELIIVDDGSDEDTREILKEQKDRDSRIRIIQNSENLGITKSLNRGIDEARGTYIARHDADDISMPERLEKQVEFMEHNEEVFLCGTNAIYIDEDGEKIGRTRKMFEKPEEIQKNLPGNNFIIHPSIVFRKTGMKYREKFKHAQDIDLYLRILSEDLKIQVLSDYLVKYRHHPDNITVKRRQEQKQFSQKALEFYWEREEKGEDSYKDFDPEEIDKNNIKRRSTRKTFLEQKMTFLLKGKNYEKAKKVLGQYRSLKDTSTSEVLFYSLPINVPILYWAYRSCRDFLRI